MKLLVRLLICILSVATVSFADDAKVADDGLELAIYLAANRHPAVNGQQAEINALGFDLESAQAQRLPILALQANANSSVSGPTPNSGDDSRSVIAVARQPIWVGGRIEGRIDRASVNLEIGRLALLATRRQLMESTVATYARVLGWRSNVEAAKRNVSEHEKLKELITRREEGGIASQADVLLASSRLSQALSQQFQLEAELNKAQNDLLSFTQQPIPARKPVAEEHTRLPATENILAAVEQVSAVLQQRELDVSLARNEVDLATAEMMPSLYARLEQDLYTYANDRELSRGTRFGLVVEGTVEGLGATNWNRVRSSGARVQVAEQNVADTRNELRRLVLSLLTELKSQQRVADSNERLVSASELTLASFMRQYDAGRKSWVDVLNAQREASQARIELEQTRSSLLETRLRLAVQLGQLDPLMDTLPTTEPIQQ